MSCESFLDEQPISEIPAAKMWKTSRDAKAGVNQIYGLFRSTMRENYFYWGEFRADNMSPGHRLLPIRESYSKPVDNRSSGYEMDQFISHDQSS